MQPNQWKEDATCQLTGQPLYLTLVCLSPLTFLLGFYCLDMRMLFYNQRINDFLYLFLQLNLQCNMDHADTLVYGLYYVSWFADNENETTNELYFFIKQLRATE